MKHIVTVPGRDLATALCSLSVRGRPVYCRVGAEGWELISYSADMEARYFMPCSAPSATSMVFRVPDELISVVGRFYAGEETDPSEAALSYEPQGSTVEFKMRHNRRRFHVSFAVGPATDYSNPWEAVP